MTHKDFEKIHESKVPAVLDFYNAWHNRTPASAGLKFPLIELQFAYFPPQRTTEYLL